MPAKALALAQLGQEELGKSWLLLAAFALPDTHESWAPFWRSWSRHSLKAHAAFFYEWLNPIQITLRGPKGNVLDGMPMRDPISGEKEAGFYVDFDHNTRVFRAPAAEISAEEAFSRTATLSVLGQNAAIIHDAAFEHGAEEILPSVGAIAARFESEFVRQEQLPHILDELAGRSEVLAQFVETIRADFAEMLTRYRALEAAQPGRQSPDREADA